MSVAKKKTESYQEIDWIKETDAICRAQRAKLNITDRIVGSFFVFVISFTFTNLIHAIYQWLTL